MTLVDTVSDAAMTALEKHKADNAKRQAKREEIAELAAQFDSTDFVKLETGFYKKSALVRISFNDLSIHARFIGGDVVTITADELKALTS